MIFLARQQTVFSSPSDLWGAIKKITRTNGGPSTQQDFIPLGVHLLSCVTRIQKSRLCFSRCIFTLSLYNMSLSLSISLYIMSLFLSLYMSVCLSVCLLISIVYLCCMTVLCMRIITFESIFSTCFDCKQNIVLLIGRTKL